MKKVSKKIIFITGRKGVLGSYFYNKYKKKYKIISFPHRLEQIHKLEEWLRKKKISLFHTFCSNYFETKKKLQKNRFNK